MVTGNEGLREKSPILPSWLGLPHYHNLLPTMGSCPLSAELVHLVLSHLNDNIFDLRSCRLASQAFSTEASRILYRSIRITLHYEPSYSERRCKLFNEMLQSKPWILNYIHSLRVDLSMEIGPWMGELRLVNYVTMDPDSIDHQEFTKLLLNMTRASGLEELVVIRGRRICCSLRHVGQDIMTALVAVRFMPSLKRLQLIGLEDPPVALVIGHPGLDRITTLSVKRGSLDIEKSEADWKGLGIPTRAALSTSFREAMVDWDSLLRVHSHLSTFNLKETPPFHEVTHIDLSPILPFYEYLQKVQKRMGGRQPLFPHLKTLHYRSFGAPTHPDSLEEPDPRILESAKEMVARECPTIQKLIVDIVIDLSDYRELYIPLASDYSLTLLFPSRSISNKGPPSNDIPSPSS